MNIENSIASFLADAAKVSVDSISLSTEVYASTAFSSLTVLELIGFIEETYEIDVGPDDLSPENFRDVGCVIDFIRGKKELMPC